MISIRKKQYVKAIIMALMIGLLISIFAFSFSPKIEASGASLFNGETLVLLSNDEMGVSKAFLMGKDYIKFDPKGDENYNKYFGYSQTGEFDYKKYGFSLYYIEEDLITNNYVDITEFANSKLVVSFDSYENYDWEYISYWEQLHVKSFWRQKYDNDETDRYFYYDLNGFVRYIYERDGIHRIPVDKRVKVFASFYNPNKENKRYLSSLVDYLYDEPDEYHDKKYLMTDEQGFIHTNNDYISISSLGNFRQTLTVLTEQFPSNWSQYTIYAFRRNKILPSVDIRDYINTVVNISLIFDQNADANYLNYGSKNYSFIDPIVIRTFDKSWGVAAPDVDINLYEKGIFATMDMLYYVVVDSRYGSKPFYKAGENKNLGDNFSQLTTGLNFVDYESSTNTFPAFSTKVGSTNSFGNSEILALYVYKGVDNGITWEYFYNTIFSSLNNANYVYSWLNPRSNINNSNVFHLANFYTTSKSLPFSIDIDFAKLGLKKYKDYTFFLVKNGIHGSPLYQHKGSEHFEPEGTATVAVDGFGNLEASVDGILKHDAYIKTYVKSPNGVVTTLKPKAKFTSNDQLSFNVLSLMQAKVLPSGFTYQIFVEFEDLDGVHIDTAVADYSYRIIAELPPDPVREGYIFTGWYYNESLTEPFIDGDIFYEDTILYAGWMPITYDVQIYDIDNALVVHKTYSYNSLLDANSINHVGYTFVGYFTDVNRSIPYSGGVIRSDLVLYAGFEQIMIKVTFIVNGEVYEEIYVPYGSSLATNQETVSILSFFSMLATDPFMFREYDKTKSITENIRVYANLYTESDDLSSWFDQNWRYVAGVGGGIVGLIILLSVVQSLTGNKRKRRR